jgi:transcriptional regulator
MYNLPYYKEQDSAIVLAFMKQHPFAMLIGVDAEQKPVATQIPFLFVERDGQLYLRGHIMKGNDHHKAFTTNQNVLAVFAGPHTYVSASWYTNQQQGSTWNYMTVHAKGEMSFLPEEALPGLLDELTSFYEKENSPALFKHIPDEYISRMVKAITAFEIKVTAIEHVFKLSQNRDQQSFENILEKLNAGTANAKAIAEEMSKRKDQLYPARM